MANIITSSKSRKIIRFIHDNPGSIASNLVRAMGFSSAFIYICVQNLIDDKYVERIDRDGRSKIMLLTKKGVSLYQMCVTIDEIENNITT
jgi:predicted transcriptional regulator